MKDKVVVRIAFASFVGAIVYWLIEFGGYMFSALTKGLFPFDAFVILIPVLFFSVGAGICVCSPGYLLLEKYDAIKPLPIVVGSVFAALVIGNTFTSSWGDPMSYWIPGAAGVVSGYVFNRSIEEKGGDAENLFS